jgi:3-mercaptopyruvate sulfurtransferase SseA
MKSIPSADHYVLTSTPPELAVFAAAEMQACSGKSVSVLQGGNAEWSKTGHPMEKGETLLASPARDRYKRPYEGTNIGPEAMQAYLDWEFGLVAQLAKDGTHHFWVL